MNQIRMRSLVLLGAFCVSAIAACSSDDSPHPRKTEVRKLQIEAGEITTLMPVDRPDEMEKIIGDNELTPVLRDGANIPQRYRRLVDAFGRMSMGCTATHIGGGIVLSAGHCFDAPPRRGSKAGCSDVKVEWGVRRDKAAYLVSTCKTILAYEYNDDRDYAIYTVDRAPPVKVGVDLRARARVDTPITIFGHPQLRPLEWSKTCMLKPGTVADWGRDQFAHQCDTEPGNSGSTVLDDRTLDVIGIHDGGIAPWNMGTYIYDTPLAEFVGRPRPAPTVRPTVPPGGRADIVVGNLGNNEDRVIASFGRDAGRAVSFTVETDVEQGYDVVLVQTGTGSNVRSARLTGKSSRTFRDLPAPVRVRFVSDGDIRSKGVAVRDIEID